MVSNSETVKKRSDQNRYRPNYKQHHLPLLPNQKPGRSNRHDINSVLVSYAVVLQK